MKQLFGKVFEGMPVLVTGHTGFKGSWLTMWLVALGANVIGYSLEEPPTEPSNFVASGIGRHITDVRGDIGDLAKLSQTMTTYKPKIVFHLAAQPIVLRSFDQPQYTFKTNALGTVNVLEAIRTTDSVKAAVFITTDKVYENREWFWGYRESDQLGGHDPYSASKAMAELAIAAYRHSFFADGKGPAVATVRAGNVIGGGDFAAYRLVPDCMRALMNGQPIAIRNPLSVRPWQHVLEPLSGYIWLAARLFQGGAEFAEAWNFGPMEQIGVTAADLAEKLVSLWGSGSWIQTNPELAKAETGLLRLSWEKSAARLGWRPVYTWEEALTEIVAWFKDFQSEDRDMLEIGLEHIQRYVNRARELKPAWAMGSD
ncbi:MAG: CDP-glucose 4,6-dehydratase [Candidatus Promineifilaceae bacterium]